MPPPSSLSHITILGAGLSGLTAAYRLSQQCPTTKITLLDSADRIGGWIKSTKYRLKVDDDGREGDVYLESGPRSIRPKGSPGAAGMLKLVRDLGLENDIIPIATTHPSAQNRFILKNGKLRKLGLNPFNTALSPSTILRAGLEPFIRSKNRSSQENDEAEKIDKSGGDESVHDFLTRRFGSGMTKLASAGMHGIYAASLEDLSARSVLGRVVDYEKIHGSVLWGLWKTRHDPTKRKEKEEDMQRWAELGELGKKREGWAMYGLRGGLGRLTDRLAEEVKKEGRVEIRMEEPVERLEPSSEGVTVNTKSGSFQTSHIISSIPVPALSTLIPSLTIPMNPRTTVGVVSLVFPLPPSQIHPNGFGYLIPRPSPSEAPSNPNGVLGVVFDSTALPGLDTLDGITKLTLMIGGPYYSSYHPILPIPTDPSCLLPAALEHLHKTFPILKGVDPILVETALHKDCIPTYAPGHVERTRGLDQRLKEGEWRGKLSLVGNEWKGVGSNNSIWTAEEVVRGLSGGQEVTGLEGI